MKKKMLILKGPGNAGKSTSLKLAFDVFLQWAVQKGKASTVHYLYVTKREVAAVIEFGDESVGIATQGDAEKQVKRGLTFFTKHRCKVVVCATRLRGKPLRAAQSFSSTHLGVAATEWVKPQDNGVMVQQAANLRSTKKLVGWLRVACR